MITQGYGSFTTDQLPEHVRLGKYSSIAADCFFHDANDNHICAQNHKCVYTTNWDQAGDPQEATIIGNDVWLGRGVRVLFGVTIGDGAIIGAGAVIAKDVPPFAVVVGNPQVIKRFRFTDEQITKLMKINWWDWPEEKIVAARADMKDIDGFLEKYVTV